MNLVAILLVAFGLFITWDDGNVGEGMNFILAALVIVLMRGPILQDIFRRKP